MGLLHAPSYSICYPLTGDIISLPRLEMAWHEGDLGCFSTFTSHPTFFNSVFIVWMIVSDDASHQHWVISTYSIGDQSWKCLLLYCVARVVDLL